MSAAIQRIVILGAESTGKSTLAAALATHYDTIWVPEYLREFVESHQRTPCADEQLFIATTQREREHKSEASAQRYLFCDTSPLMTAIYSEHYFGEVDAALSALAGQHDYAATIVTTPTTPWMPDGLQRESDAVRQRIHARLMRKLDEGDIAHLLVAGTTQQRIAQVKTYLAQRDGHWRCQ